MLRSIAFAAPTLALSFVLATARPGHADVLPPTGTVRQSVFIPFTATVFDPDTNAVPLDHPFRVPERVSLVP